MLITKKQLEHYWYYYKWQTIAALFAVVALIYTLYSCAMKVEPDLVVTYAGTFPLQTTDMLQFEQEYAAYINDINGDHKKTISFQKIMFTPKTDSKIIDKEAEYAAMSRLTAEFMVGNTTLYLFSSDMLPVFQEAEVMQPLKEKTAIEGDYVNLAGKPVLTLLKLSNETYAAIRVEPSKQKENDMKHYENAYLLLDAINK